MLYLLFYLAFFTTCNHTSGSTSHRKIAQVVNTLKTKDTLIISYKDYLQDLPFYTKSRIAIYDYLGELEFGSKHDSGQGWFFNKEEFLSTWEQNPHAILVVPQKYKQNV